VPSSGRKLYRNMVVQKKRAGRLFFAGIADFGDDLLPQHLAAVIEHFNQAGARSAGVGHNRSQFSAGKQADNLPLVFSGLHPELVLLPLSHALLLVSHTAVALGRTTCEGESIQIVPKGNVDVEIEFHAGARVLLLGFQHVIGVAVEVDNALA